MVEKEFPALTMGRGRESGCYGDGYGARQRSPKSVIVAVAKIVSVKGHNVIARTITIIAPIIRKMPFITFVMSVVLGCLTVSITFFTKLYITYINTLKIVMSVSLMPPPAFFLFLLFSIIYTSVVFLRNEIIFIIVLLYPKYAGDVFSHGAIYCLFVIPAIYKDGVMVSLIEINYLPANTL